MSEYIYIITANGSKGPSYFAEYFTDELEAHQVAQAQRQNAMERGNEVSIQVGTLREYKDEYPHGPDEMGKFVAEKVPGEPGVCPADAEHIVSTITDLTDGLVKIWCHNCFNHRHVAVT